MNSISRIAIAVTSATIGALGAIVPTASEAAVSVGVSVGTPYLSVGYQRGAARVPRASYWHNSWNGPRHYTPRVGYWGPRWRVGAWVPLLPIGYATYWWGGVPYYMYDDTYYVTDGRGYRVVEKPRNESVISDPGPVPVISAPPAVITPGAPTPSFEQAARTGQLYAYPRNGQSTSAATFDRIECESWGSKQTGFVPGQSPDDGTKKADYTRAVGACLEGRGYTVK